MEARNRVLAGMRKEHPEAFFELPDPVILLNRKTYHGFRRQHKLPAMYSFNEYVDAGGLMSCGTSFPALFHRRDVRGQDPQKIRLVTGSRPVTFI